MGALERAPLQTGTDQEPIVRASSSIFVRFTAEFHFRSQTEFLVDNRVTHCLAHGVLPSAIIADLLLEKQIEAPMPPRREFLAEKELEFIGIGGSAVDL